MLDGAEHPLGCTSTVGDMGLFAFSRVNSGAATAQARRSGCNTAMGPSAARCESVRTMTADDRLSILSSHHPVLASPAAAAMCTSRAGAL